jgi:DNA-binding MarR family transcriptional regulator
MSSVAATASLERQDPSNSGPQVDDGLFNRPSGRNRGPIEISANVTTLASGLYRLRRRRERIFAHGIFSEPSWDLLLELFIAERTGNLHSVKSACISTTASTTTAVRSLRQLEAQGLIYREADLVDKRRIYVRLQPSAVRSMDGLFEDLWQCLSSKNA